MTNNSLTNNSLTNKAGSVWLPVVFVLVMLALDIWFFQKTFLRQANELPRLKINVFTATSFILENSPGRPVVKFQPARNILVLGRAGQNNPAPDLTDTIFIARVKGENKSIKIVSIPRDLAVRTNNGPNITKINALWQLGSERSEKEGLRFIQDKVEEISGLKMDYFVLFDLGVVEQIIDDIGGINVNVINDIYDPRFPAPGGGYEAFQLSGGFRYLDGQTALKFIRTRATPRGDFDRIAHQQEVIRAIKGKFSDLNPAWNFSSLWKIFRTVQKNVRTNLTLADLNELWLQTKDTNLDGIQTLSLEPDSGLVKPAEMNFADGRAYILVATGQPYEYAKIKKAVADFITNNHD